MLSVTSRNIKGVHPVETRGVSLESCPQVNEHLTNFTHTCPTYKTNLPPSALFNLSPTHRRWYDRTPLRRYHPLLHHHASRPSLPLVPGMADQRRCHSFSDQCHCWTCGSQQRIPLRSVLCQLGECLARSPILPANHDYDDSRPSMAATTFPNSSLLKISPMCYTPSPMSAIQARCICLIYGRISRSISPVIHGTMSEPMCMVASSSSTC